MREGIREIPQRLRGHDEAVPFENPALTLERDVIEPLVENDLDRERERIATTRCGALGTERRLDAATAAATYFCCWTWTSSYRTSMTSIISDSSNWPAHGRSSPPQLGHIRSGVVELEQSRHGRESWLRRRPELRPRPLFLLALLSATLLLLLGALYRIGAGSRLLLQLLEHLQRELKIAGLTAQALDLAALGGDDVEELLDLDLLGVGDATELLDVLFVLDVDRHASY